MLLLCLASIRKGDPGLGRGNAMTCRTDVPVTPGTSDRYNGRSLRAVIQRVSSAHVGVNGRFTGRIGKGLVVFLGVGHEDTAKDAAYLAGKTAGLRVFEGVDGRMTRSVRDVGGAVLVVSQFTLYGDVRRGLRPSFDRAAAPELAEALYERYVEMLTAAEVDVATGEFRANMQVSLVNEGPVTILLDSTKLL